jgi:DNA-binding transcriptional LysR family regulator
MQMNQVRYFLALCEEQNFTRAAKRCGVSQPSLTNAIKRLERTFGGPLFYQIEEEENSPNLDGS